MKLRGWTWSAVLLVAACSDPRAGEGTSSSGGTSPIGSGGSRSGTGGTGGRGGSAGTYSLGGATGTGGAAADAGLGAAGGSDGGGGASDAMCGGVQCAAAELFPGFPVDACCPDGVDQASCGLDTSLLTAIGLVPPEACMLTNAPGRPESTCPTVNLAGLLDLAGCCTPAGACGLQADALGLGCQTPAALGVGVDGGAQSCVP